MRLCFFHWLFLFVFCWKIFVARMFFGRQLCFGRWCFSAISLSENVGCHYFAGAFHKTEIHSRLLVFQCLNHENQKRKVLLLIVWVCLGRILSTATPYTLTAPLS